ncbi:ribokinase [Propionibacteriaceae bacterium ES.041]|uniref:ribokinase n=1 Tax=Enemella evansiae TaxID=2016499 RepID=UPI000B963881|nr:ribokinase [Enemella evansiae]OYN99178.1 ribokinase [Enemella evansiae]PFG67274.1 ribokinase [Propionibacteriaceae bacterium ES.041]TDO93134.1 ribokinase [Enemella evansiae]
MATVAVIGSIMTDLITYLDRMPERGETIAAPSFAMGHGGKGANQATAAARLGSEVVMVAKVGTDSFGEQTLANFRANGIDTSDVTVAEGPSGVAPIFVEPDGSNRVVIVPGANEALTPGDVQAARSRIAQAAIIVLQLEIPLPTVYAAIELGAELGVPVLLNPAPANAELDFDQVARCAFFAPNESELALLTGMPVETLQEIEAAAQTLLAKGVRAVLVTLGERGVLRCTADGVEHIAGITVQAADSTGAGDAFIGAFAHRYAADGDVGGAIEFANRYAADSVTRRGTQSSFATAEEFAG